MAKQDAVKVEAPKLDGHKHDGEDQDCTRVTFGPFGDKLLHGTKLAYGKAESDASKRSKDDVLKADSWCFSYWMPANDAEVRSFANAKPATVGMLLGKALESKARFLSWQANRGGSVTEYVKVNGKDAKRLDKEVVELLRAAGHKVEIVSKPVKSK